MFSLVMQKHCSGCAPACCSGISDEGNGFFGKTCGRNPDRPRRSEKDCISRSDAFVFSKWVRPWKKWGGKDAVVGMGKVVHLPTNIPHLVRLGKGGNITGAGRWGGVWWMGLNCFFCMEKGGIYIFRVLWRKAFWEPYSLSDMQGSTHALNQQVC